MIEPPIEMGTAHIKQLRAAQPRKRCRSIYIIINRKEIYLTLEGVREPRGGRTRYVISLLHRT